MNRNMIMNKTIGAWALVLGLTAAAQAQTVYITGSQADKVQVFGALQDLGLTVQQSGTSGNNSFTFTGTISDTTPGSVLNLGTVAPGFAGNVVTVYGSFTGGAEGIDDLINPQALPYVSVGSSGTFSSSHIDIALADNSQNSTPDANNPDQLEEVQLPADAALHNGLPGTGIAVQPYTFVVNGNASTVKNITQENFKDLYNGSGLGRLQITMLNGNGNTNPVYAVGRYSLSSVRITAILDDQFGVPSSRLTQWALSANETTTPGLASTDTASPPSSGSTWLSVGTNGYFSGGNLEKAIQGSTAGGAPAAIGILAFSDANKLTGLSNEAPINWNGQVSYSGGTFPQPAGDTQWNITGVENGSYTFWTYEHLYVSDADQSTWYDQTFAPGLIDAIQYEITHTAGVAVPANQTSVLESQMNVYRANDGSDVVHY
jgi:hypothetical protein